MTDLPTVVVTGAGGPAGIAVLRELTALTTVVAADADPTAAGLRLAPLSGLLPHCGDPDFPAAVVDLCVRTGATALVTTVAEEMLACHAQQELLQGAGIATWLPPAATVTDCIDKWRFAQRIAQAGVPAPATGLGGVAGVPGPWVVKPRFGRGSRDVYLVDTQEDAAWALARLREPIVQTRLTGREFTVDTLSGRDGELLAAVPRWRVETKAGISTKGVTFTSARLRDVVAHLLHTLAMTGPANVQGFFDHDGAISIMEVNPRFSGGLPLSLAAGAQLVEEYVRGIAGLPVRRERLHARPGVRMTRYFAEIFEDLDPQEAARWAAQEAPEPEPVLDLQTSPPRPSS